MYHEVQTVTSGYRLVLAYNLIQKGVSKPQKAPTGEEIERMAALFNKYNTCLGELNKSWPSYLVHRLDHEYTQDGLKLDGLKGGDFDRVDRLKAVCEKTDFDIYLALMEKVVTKDDEDNRSEEEICREEEIKHVHDLVGNDVSIAPRYDKENVLDGYNTDDEEYAQSAHEGYTGNAGATAMY